MEDGYNFSKLLQILTFWTNSLWLQLLNKRAKTHNLTFEGGMSPCFIIPLNPPPAVRICLEKGSRVKLAAIWARAVVTVRADTALNSQSISRDSKTLRFLLWSALTMIFHYININRVPVQVWRCLENEFDLVCCFEKLGNWTKRLENHGNLFYQPQCILTRHLIQVCILCDFA